MRLCVWERERENTNKTDRFCWLFFLMSYALFHMFCAILRTAFINRNLTFYGPCNVCVWQTIEREREFRLDTHTHTRMCVPNISHATHMSVCANTGTNCFYVCMHAASKEFPILRNTICITHKYIQFVLVVFMHASIVTFYFTHSLILSLFLLFLALSIVHWANTSTKKNKSRQFNVNKMYKCRNYI